MWKWSWIRRMFLFIVAIYLRNEITSECFNVLSVLMTENKLVNWTPEFKSMLIKHRQTEAYPGQSYFNRGFRTKPSHKVTHEKHKTRMENVYHTGILKYTWFYKESSSPDLLTVLWYHHHSLLHKHSYCYPWQCNKISMLTLVLGI